MTSLTSESAATIICTAKQTRFHIESPNYRELDIDGLSISVKTDDGAKGKTKAKSRSDSVELLSHARLRLKEGQRYALIGRNGTGKSTLLRAIADKLIPGIPEETRVAILQQTRLTDQDEGGSAPETGLSVLQQVINRATARDTVEQEIKLLSQGVHDTDARCGAVKALRTLKHERLQKRLFILDKNARLRSGARGMQARKALVACEKEVAESQRHLEEADGDLAAETLAAETVEATDLLAELQLQVEPTRVAQMEARAKKVLVGLGFSEERMARPIGNMSGGWHMRASLAAALLQDADLLILDEPTNFLDLLGIIWLQRYLGDNDDDGQPTLVVVSHDRDFVTGLCTDLLVLRDAQITPFHGDLPAFEASQAERKLWLRKMKDAQDKQRAHVERTIQQNLKVGRANDDLSRIRQAKSRQKRLDDRWGMQVNARGGRFKLNRDMPGYHTTARDQVEVAPEERPVVIALPEPPDLRFPGSLLSLDNVSFRYPGTGTGAVLSGVTLSVAMGDRIGILGLNGSGKSTLVRLLVHESRPTSGAADSHPRLRLGYYSQHAVEELKAIGRAEPDLTALALLTRETGSELSEGEVRGLLSQLGLPGRLASDVPLHRLSGGQLVRCQLARLFWRRPHCLVLDEVTTHLDYETVTALRIAMHHWEGAVVLVSHDRWFMRGAVEANLDDEDDDEADGASLDSSDGYNHGDASHRRRAVYRLHQGQLAVLNEGVEQFEKLMEKRARKLLDR